MLIMSIGAVVCLGCLIASFECVSEIYTDNVYVCVVLTDKSLSFFVISPV